jgi:ubiquinone/menaquinone biosynthesis C-methylase UbiE
MSGRHGVYSAKGAGLLTSRLRSFLNPPRKVLNGYIHEGDTILDFGCGPGYFTLPMAEMAGPTGRIIAVDSQEEMLSIVRRRAEDAGLSARIRIHRSLPQSLAITDVPPVGFALAYHVMHETADPARILGEIAATLRPGGLFLLAEPMYVVNRAEFRTTAGLAKRAGLSEAGTPWILLSRTALLRKS